MKLTGTGSYLPKRILDNSYMEEIVDTTDEWIVERTGISERHVLSEGETSVDMAYGAAKAAIRSAGIDKKKICAVVCAGFTAEDFVPCLACRIIERLGIACPAFDISAACTGFLYAMKAAEPFLKEGSYVLIIGAEALSKITDYTDRRTCVLFGDAAGAAVFGCGDGIEYIDVRAYGDPKNLLHVGNILPDNAMRDGFLHMEGQEVFKFATREIGRLATEAMDALGITSAGIDAVVPHQANLRIIQYAEKKLGMSADKFFLNLAHVGNTSAASIPVALDEAVKSGFVKSGQRIMLLGFGGGLTSGVAVMRI